MILFYFRYQESVNELYHYGSVLVTLYYDYYEYDYYDDELMLLLLLLL